MSIWNYINRTFTYIAGDWDADIDAVKKLKQWNESNHWGLNFKDVHNLTSSRDSSLNCMIKNSLRGRMSICKTFVLIVGEHTRSLTGGSCGNCRFREYKYSLGKFVCKRGYSYDSRGYVDFECELAKKSNINIIVLYKGYEVDENKCPDSLRGVGQHIPMYIMKMNCIGELYFDWYYNLVKEAFDKIR